jgi:hypothetical protein
MDKYSNGNGRGGGTGIRFQSIHHKRPKPRNPWESPDPYFNPEFESEWEIQEAGHSVYSARVEETEWEAPFLFQQVLHNIRNIAQATAPIAKQIGAIAAKTLMQATSGHGKQINPRTNRFLKTLLWEGEKSAAYLEAEWFGYSAIEMEILHSPTAYDAALSEVLAAEASHAHSEREATAFVGAVLPMTICTIGGQPMVLPVMPALLSRTVRLGLLLFHRGPAGRRLLRLLPSILRRTLISLHTARHLGHPLSSPLVGQVMASHTARIFGNPRLVSQLITRNAVIRQRTVSVH